ncbi:MAG: hypothetical protein P1U42_03635 [Phycisphaerales bacterium]|nr:hypothetical protein [Phycisphaerales bacterium]
MPYNAHAFLSTFEGWYLRFEGTVVDSFGLKAGQNSSWESSGL